jgi:hypothetical protein
MCKRIAALLAVGILLVGCTLTPQDVEPTLSPDLPAVEFLYPVNNTTVLEGTDLQIRVLAQDVLSEDSGGGIARVELLVDDTAHQQGSPVEAETVPVFTVEMNWLAESLGFHSLTAIAFRADGTQSVPQTIRITVIAADP